MKHLVEPIRNKKQVYAVEKYLSQKNKRNQLIFVLGINSGLRISDILNLNIGDVRNKSHIELHEKKTKKYKKFPINSKLRGLLKEFIKDRADEEPLFLSQKKHRLDRSQAYRMLNEACTAVGITANIGNHSLRKTFGFHHYKQFKDVAMLQTIFNHATPAVTLRYIGISQDQIDNSYRLFEL